MTIEGNATQAGKALFAKRNSTVGIRLGIITHVLGFRQFLLRDSRSVQGWWALVGIG